jgi:hypothetical protein
LKNIVRQLLIVVRQVPFVARIHRFANGEFAVRCVSCGALEAVVWLLAADSVDWPVAGWSVGDFWFRLVSGVLTEGRIGHAGTFHSYDRPGHGSKLWQNPG